MIIPKRFELTARYEFIRFDKNGVLLGPDGENGGIWLNWFTFGFNYFFKGHQSKIQLNYIVKNEKMPEGIPEPKNNTLLVQFAYYF